MNALLFSSVIAVMAALIGAATSDESRKNEPPKTERLYLPKSPLLQVNPAPASITWKQDLDSPLFKLPLLEKRKLVGCNPSPMVAPFGVRIAKGKQNYEAFSSYRVEAVKRGRIRAGEGAVDLRELGFVTGIRNQKQCGSCVAHGTIASAESVALKQLNKPNAEIDLSEHDLFFCEGAETGAACSQGWQMEPALAALEKGVATEEEVPYDLGYPSCPINAQQAQKVRITGWKPMQGIDEMKSYISEKGALNGVISVFGDFMAYGGGLYTHSYGEEVGLHAIAIVGFDDQGWFLKNSWGESWGENGYAHIAYGEIGIESEAFGIEGVEGVENAIKIPQYAHAGRFHRPGCNCYQCRN